RLDSLWASKFFQQAGYRRFLLRLLLSGDEQIVKPLQMFNGDLLSLVMSKARLLQIGLIAFQWGHCEEPVVGKTCRGKCLRRTVSEAVKLAIFRHLPQQSRGSHYTGCRGTECNGGGSRVQQYRNLDHCDPGRACRRRDRLFPPSLFASCRAAPQRRRRSRTARTAGTAQELSLRGEFA